MDLAKYIVKARPGMLGGKHEEKRPLRQLSALPVKRHIFINRDSHPDADIYVAIHEAKDLPSPVPDYQVPHCHNTDEFYYFIGTNADLTGLEGQIIFEGKVHKIISPACVYIPTGAVHEYKVTKGAGTVTVALSVISSTTPWSSSTVSPAFTSHLTISPSTTPSPRSGSLNSNVATALSAPRRAQACRPCSMRPFMKNSAAR